MSIVGKQQPPNGFFGPGSQSGGGAGGSAIAVPAGAGGMGGVVSSNTIGMSHINITSGTGGLFNNNVFGSIVMERYIAVLKDTMTKMLACCTKEQRDVFRNMYDRNFKFNNPVDALTFPQMDHAFMQLENTLKWSKK